MDSPLDPLASKRGPQHPSRPYLVERDGPDKAMHRDDLMARIERAGFGAV